MSSNAVFTPSIDTKSFVCSHNCFVSESQSFPVNSPPSACPKSMIPVIAVAPVVPAKTRKSIKDSPTPNTPSTIEVALVPMVAPVLSKMVPICSPPSITSGAIF